MQTNVKMSDDVEEEKEKSTLELSKVDFPYCIIQKDKSQSSNASLSVKPAFSMAYRTFSSRWYFSASSKASSFVNCFMFLCNYLVYFVHEITNGNEALSEGV